jgi:hypothetical protein
LAISHLLVLLGYLAVARDSVGSASVLAQVGAFGSAVAAACELWSGLVADTDLDSVVITVLDASYAASAVAGWANLRQGAAG